MKVMKVIKAITVIGGILSFIGFACMFLGVGAIEKGELPIQGCIKFLLIGFPILIIGCIFVNIKDILITLCDDRKRQEFKVHAIIVIINVLKVIGCVILSLLFCFILQELV